MAGGESEEEEEEPAEAEDMVLAPSDVAFRCKDRSASHRRRITSYTSSSCSRSLPRKIADSSYFRVAWTNMIPRRTDEKYCRRVRPSRAMADKFSATLLLHCIIAAGTHRADSTSSRTAGLSQKPERGTLHFILLCLNFEPEKIPRSASQALQSSATYGLNSDCSFQPNSDALLP